MLRLQLCQLSSPALILPVVAKLEVQQHCLAILRKGLWGRGTVPKELRNAVLREGQKTAAGWEKSATGKLAWLLSSVGLAAALAHAEY